MVDKRPVNLDITTIRMPVTAITSILHRLSGVLLFLVIAFLLWGLQHSLASEQGFQEIVALLAKPSIKFVLWLCLSALAYHFVAGIRHLLMDMGFFEEKVSGKVAAVTVIIVSIVLIAGLGCWLW